jgi:hypothetical protein
MENYLVVLFKNKTKKRIIKKFITINKAQTFFKNLIKKCDNVIFSKEYESGYPCNFEVGIIGKTTSQNEPVYMKDQFGRNVKVKLENDGMSLISIAPYRKEEKLFDIQKNKKIDTQTLIKDYISLEGVKMISTLHNKIIIQINEKVFLFSLKNESESNRFVDCLTSYFFKIKRGDCIFVKDYSSAQRKYLFDVLEKNGVDKKILYRKFTTYPRSK